jgi:hypothetical protein
MTHYARWRRYGDTSVVNSRASWPKGTQHKASIDLSYNGVHYRLEQTRGKAREHQCIWCPNQASDWAYRWDTTKHEVLYDSRNHPYGPNLADYDPACRSCHVNFDRGEFNAAL